MVLGVETSCDETSVAVVSSNKHVLFHEIFTQDHRIYNGVYPEFASREHLKILPLLLEKASLAHDLKSLDAIAYTKGPGLIGSLIVGTMMAQGLAFSLGKRILAINHLEGHILASRLFYEIDFPFIALLISGGHSQLVCTERIGKYNVLGETLDDAFGETFDKLATMLGFPYPGGKTIEKFALNGNPSRFHLPGAMINQSNCNFSLSGIKTALKKIIDSLPIVTSEDKADICASFQACVVKIITSKLEQAVKISGHRRIVLTGGVGSNLYIRESIQEFANERGLSLYFPPVQLCTDNAAMIAWAAIERMNFGCKELSPEPQPRLKFESL
ncbi:tRNA threonylcarbamoyl adenosine modification protein YgjD [Neorickettsia helminthoeca str. Oregon]|uniref:tRNA N6-adenosine threonylcarbamoyltransferase n=1 Tax=Neorickettsia helminthoeca str. Oregon TaxID=1286528 RepID=X5HLC6_9RICK|nr:tRNA threonylcarbamoyl adenosine modification protein YgjD [Neorickettsia helminthoeca str. Oregon]